jgi:hypothetical protein
LVLIDAMSTVTVTLDSRGFSAAFTTASNFSKVPRALLIA